MYAVIATGGKQYRVSEGQTVQLEKISSEPGSTIHFDQILMIGEGDSVKIGKPYLKGSKVTGEIIAQGRAKKVKIVKFRRRKHHMKQMGHRQSYTAVKITSIKEG